ncbi:MAG: glycosyltransferase [Desulfobacteraceae bacterium]|nr:MAG: glycosyltransferase [Desulfobacteraceae bacterium]
MNECILDIIIVNYKSTNFLIKSLKSIYNDIGQHLVNIFIQDNASHDGIEEIMKCYPGIQLTINTKNIGFAKAINNTIKNSRSPYIMIVNPDTIIRKGFFQTVLRYMDEHRDIGIVGPQILNHDGSVQGSARAFPTPISGFFGRTSFLSRWFPNNWITRNNILTKKINGTLPVEVDWISGACMVIRRSALADVGLLDERFYMYWEDVDWCKRMWMKGWKVVYYPKIQMVHFVGGSSNKRPAKSLYEFHRSCYLYFVKHKAWPSIILKPALFLGLSSRLLLLSLFLFFRRETAECREVGQPKILFLITEDWYFWSHRLPLARAARDSGFEVLIATRVHGHQECIQQEGFRLIPIRLERKSKSLLKELQGFIDIVKIYKKEKPDIVHHVAIKPVLYGSWAARLTHVPFVVNAIAGLGFIFVAQGKKSSIIRRLAQLAYKTAFLPENTIGIFQNPDDLNLFINSKILKKKRTVIIRGSGVDTSVYQDTPEKNGVPCVVFASRMLWDKGVGEYIDAAKQIQEQGMNYRFLLIGDPDPENPMSIPKSFLEKWHREGIVEWRNHSNEIPAIFADANIVVLPSYREGLPKVLLEAASCGRAIVATDVPGCREIVRNNETGFLIPPYDSKALAEAIINLATNHEKRIQMGKRNREIVVNEFSEEIVVRKTMNIYDHFLGKSTQAGHPDSEHHLLN